ncbi:TPA: hypothetical protein ACMDVO_003518 [Vibrio cholerae]|uniref:hypothetical protein n=1 Tax=Vibrio cholerae TaxID=666 RepID=UPI0022702A67|nr:hypothetical protein [Vibrio cholerae]MCX9439916.1 hypothetical protein [Vibrio cholerae]HDI3164209.1 hypothetical protein [Vibrio cholerae]
MYEVLTVESDYRISEDQYAVLKRYILDIGPVVDVKVDEVSSQKLSISHVGISTDVEAQTNALLKAHRSSFEGQSDYKFSPKKDLPCQCGSRRSTDITSELLDEGLISYSKGGEFYYSEELRQAIESVDKKFLEYFTNFQAIEYLYSQPLIAVNSLSKIQSLDRLSREALIATHFDGVHIDKMDQSVGSSTAALQSAPCLKVYLHFEGEEIYDDRLLSTRGMCFRNETKELFTFERMMAFNQRELIVIGDVNFVQEKRDFLINEYVKFLKHLGLEAFVESANDPFFMDTENKGKYQISGDVKTEIRAPLSDQKTISVGSFDYHGTFFGQKCSITKGSETAQSGCLGIGLERVVWTALQQKGLEWVKTNL